MVNRALIATLGFDERHVIKSLVDIGMSNVYKIVLLVPKGDYDERTDKAIKIIREISKYAGLSPESSVIVKEIDVLNLWSGVKDILNILHELFLEGVDEYLISLGGGLRILVIEALLASLIVNRNIADKITIRVGLESSGEGVSFKVNTIPICIEITETEKRILESIGSGIKSLTQISRETNIPKSTVWKITRKLADKNIVKIINRKYTLSELGRVLLKLT